MICTDSLTGLADLGVSRVALACGVFDGLHLGHQAIMAELVREAEETNATPLMLTFDPHPAAVLAPGKEPKRILSHAHKLHILEQLGVKGLILLPFTKDLAATPPRAFVERILLQANVELTAVCVGEGWRFGYQGAGNANLLRELGEQHDFHLCAVPEVRDESGVISATRIRERLKEGDLDTAAAMLRRTFSVMGTVSHGRGIGDKELHYPTANIEPDCEALPPRGIYAARARLNEISYDGVLYLGNAPTFVDAPQDRPILEVHIFDFDSDIYGREMEVEFLSFIRPDEKFANTNALCQQIGRDVEAARQIHAAATTDSQENSK